MMDNFVLFAQLLKGLNRLKCSKGGSGSEEPQWENVKMFLDSDLVPKMSYISIPLDSLHFGNAKEPETFTPKPTLL